mgnify:CR=1 FL=1
MGISVLDTKKIVYESVDCIIRELFPEKYDSLCHVYAVVGANVSSILLKKDYRPVAGLAVIDAGGGNFFKLIDNWAFYGDIGGAYHCWIESGTNSLLEKELIDFTYKHNPDYARKNGMIWRKKKTPDYLWGLYKELVIAGNHEALPQTFPHGKVWFRETLAGSNWLSKHVEQYSEEYVRMTSIALKHATISMENIA